MDQYNIWDQIVKLLVGSILNFYFYEPVNMKMVHFLSRGFPKPICCFFMSNSEFWNLLVVIAEMAADDFSASIVVLCNF